MSIKFTCDDKQTLVAYLYGEIDHADATGGRRAPRRVRGVRGGSDGAWRRAIGAGPVGAARRRARLHDRQEVRAAAGRTCCAPRAGGTPCRRGRRPPPRSSCSPRARRSPTCRCKSGPRGFRGDDRLDAPAGASPERAVRRAKPPSEARLETGAVALEQQLRNEIRSTREPETRVARRARRSTRRRSAACSS